MKLTQAQLDELQVRITRNIAEDDYQVCRCTEYGADPELTNDGITRLGQLCRVEIEAYLEELEAGTT